MRFLYPFLVVLLSAWAVAPLAYPGIFQTHYGLAPLYNLIDLNTHLSSSFGWVPHWGRSFDLFRNEGIFPYALAEFFHLIGFDYLSSVKAVYSLSLFGSGLGMFLLVKDRLDKVMPDSAPAAGLLSAIVYLYLPYHLAVVYVRGAFAESMMWATAPFALLLLIRLQENSSLRMFALTLITYVLLFLSNFGLAIVISIFVVLAAISFRLSYSRKSSLALFARALLPVFVSAFLAFVFELPTLSLNQFAIQADAFRPVFVIPFQLITATWGADIPSGSFLEMFPFQLGIAGIMLTSGSIYFALQSRGQNGIMSRWLLNLLILGGFSLAFAMLPLPSLMRYTGLANLVNAPWEFLFLVNLIIAVVSGFIVVSERRFAQPALLAGLLIMPMLASYQYLAPTFVDFSDSQPPVAVFNSNELALLDYKVIRPTGTIFHGATVQLDLHWQALRPIDKDYVITFQALDADGKIWGQQDIMPQDGSSPTSHWVPGMVISDTHTLQVDLEGPREGYRLILALYQSPSGERARTDTGESEIEIRPNE